MVWSPQAQHQRVFVRGTSVGPKVLFLEQLESILSYGSRLVSAILD